MILAVLLLLVDLSLDDARQSRLALTFADENGVRLVGLTHDETAAVAMVSAHEAEAVVTAVEPRDGFPAWLVSRVAAAHGQILVARRHLSVVHDVRGDLIRTAVDRLGGDVERAAYLLGIDVAAVRAAVSRPSTVLDANERRPLRIR